MGLHTILGLVWSQSRLPIRFCWFLRPKTRAMNVIVATLTREIGSVSADFGAVVDDGGAARLLLPSTGCQRLPIDDVRGRVSRRRPGHPFAGGEMGVRTKPDAAQARLAGVISWLAWTSRCRPRRRTTTSA